MREAPPFFHRLSFQSTTINNTTSCRFGGLTWITTRILLHDNSPMYGQMACQKYICVCAGIAELTSWSRRATGYNSAQSTRRRFEYTNGDRDPTSTWVKVHVYMCSYLIASNTVRTPMFAKTDTGTEACVTQ